MLKKLQALFVAALVVSLGAMSIPAAAVDGTPSGKITTIEVAAATNYAFRVYLNGGGTVLCPSGSGFAYLNEADSNYKVYVASLLMAKAQGSTVTLILTNEGGFCHIVQMAIGS
jgi:hypothetical protein